MVISALSALLPAFRPAATQAMRPLPPPSSVRAVPDVRALAESQKLDAPTRSTALATAGTLGRRLNAWA